MSTKAKTKPKPKKKNPIGNIVWFDIPADDMGRAKTFYNKLFGWKIKPMPGMADYWHIDTGGADDSPDGAVMQRKHEHHTITNYVFVKSAANSAAKVEKLGGKICMARTAVPQMGYFVICQDTEGNAFAIWEMNPNAK